MAEMYAQQGFSSSPKVVEFPSSEVAGGSGEARPKSAKEIAALYKVSDKTVQTWFRIICEAYLWIKPSDLKTGSSNKVRYTLLFQELLTEFRAASDQMSSDDWITSVHKANADKLSASSASVKEEPKSDSDEIVDGEVVETDQSGSSSIALKVLGIEGLTLQQQQQNDALSLQGQTIEALNQANQKRLQELAEYFQLQGSQRTLDREQKQQQLEAEGANEGIEEFLIKYRAKNAMTAQLEQLNSLGKVTNPGDGSQ